MQSHRATAVASVMLAASIGLGAFSAGADMQLTSKTPPSFDKSAFEQSAHQALKDKVMGYSFLIMKDGKLVSEGAGGKARNRADGFKLMTTSTPQNLGSLFKFISGVSMLHILERPPAGSAGGQGSFGSRLDAPVALLYPQIWQSAIETPAIRTITFRQLLQHKSGFRGCSDPMDCFSGTFDADLIGKRDYQNINFSLTGYMIGVYTKPSILTNTNAIANSTPVAEKDRVFTIASGLQMDSFINDKVFKLVPGKISASCDAANEYKNTGAYAYKSAADKGNGIITSRMAVRQAMQRRWRILDVDPRLRQFRCPCPALERDHLRFDPQDALQRPDGVVRRSHGVVVEDVGYLDQGQVRHDQYHLVRRRPELWRGPVGGNVDRAPAARL